MSGFARILIWTNSEKYARLQNRINLSRNTYYFTNIDREIACNRGRFAPIYPSTKIEKYNRGRGIVNLRRCIPYWLKKKKSREWAFVIKFPNKLYRAWN